MISNNIGQLQIMVEISCCICKTIITGNIFKAFDKSFCSVYCRKTLIHDINCNERHILTKNYSPTKIIVPEEPIPFDLSLIDINYASYNYRRDILGSIYHTREPPTFKSYIRLFFYDIIERFLPQTDTLG